MPVLQQLRQADQPHQMYEYVCVSHPPARGRPPALYTGRPLGGVGRSLLLPHPSGITVGLMGLVEGDWVETLSTIEPEDVQ